MSALSSSIYSRDHHYKAQVQYSSDRPGSGKTEAAIALMCNSPRKWLYVVDRIEVMQDRIQRIRAKNQSVEINQIHTDDVAENLLFWSINNTTAHQILIITHAGLLISDLSQFVSWSLIIDEVFEPFVSNIGCSEITADVLDRFFTIRDGWLIIKKGINVSGLYRDTMISDSMRKMYNAAKIGRVAINIDSFHETKKWHWYSVWNFDELKVFDDIYVFANSFTNSMMYKFMALAGFNFNRLTLAKQNYKPRDVVIRYFDCNNRATQTFFESGEGKEALALLRKFYAEQPNDRIWTKNNENMAKLTMSGHKLSPKVAGSNEYRHLTKAAIIYKSKPSTDEEAVLNKFNITKQELIRAREIETIIQFVTRTSIREADDSRTCEFDVYDIDQAEALKAYLDSLGIGLAVSIRHIDLSIPVRLVKESHRPKTGQAKPAKQRMAEMRQRNKIIKENMKRLKRPVADVI